MSSQDEMLAIADAALAASWAENHRLVALLDAVKTITDRAIVRAGRDSGKYSSLRAEFVRDIVALLTSSDPTTVPFKPSPYPPDVRPHASIAELGLAERIERTERIMRERNR